MRGGEGEDSTDCRKKAKGGWPPPVIKVRTSGLSDATAMDSKHDLRFYDLFHFYRFCSNEKCKSLLIEFRSSYASFTQKLWSTKIFKILPFVHFPFFIPLFPFIRHFLSSCGIQRQLGSMTFILGVCPSFY